MKIELVDKDNKEILYKYESTIEPHKDDIISLDGSDYDKIFVVSSRNIYSFNSTVIVCYGKMTKMAYLKNNNH